MNAGIALLMIVSLVSADARQVSGSGSTVLAAESSAAMSPYIEITDLPPVAARRVIRAVPRTEMLRAETSRPDVEGPEVRPASVQLASRNEDITPIGYNAPISSSTTTTSTIVPSGSNVVMQPVEPANTRPYLAPGTVSGTTRIAPSATHSCQPASQAYPSSVTYSAPVTTYPSVTYPSPTYSSPVTYQQPATYALPQPAVAATGLAVNSDLTIGRGILGQPKVFIDGQPLRNALRWLTP